ncbi:MAG TPA: hypothetical protein VL728_15750 [Cyclobacteriaceae bacterium]|jgi:hypothetical protein|nr:hypothetical protein [Cyclobacteriaceae bacterium]
MISSRNLVICVVYLAACASPQKESAEVSDSEDSATTADAPRSTRHKPTEDENGLTYDIDSSLEPQELTIFGKTEAVSYWISKFYSQDHRINSKIDTLGAPGYLIKSVEMTEREYSDVKGQCVSRPVLLILRDIIMSGEEYYDIHFLTNDQGVSSEKVTYDGSIAQSTGSVSLSADFKLTKKCPTLAIIREYEGGDIDFGRMKEISFFVVSDAGMESVFDLVREYTLAKEYEVTGDENKNSTSEVRDFEILKTKTNDFFDIKVHATNKKDGEIVEEKETIFRFDGEKYSDKLAN